MGSDDLSVLKAAASGPAVMLSFRLATDRNGMCARTAVPMSGCASAAIVMAVNLVHGLAIITDGMCLTIITMGDAVTVSPAVASFTSRPAVGTELITACVVVMDILYCITATAILRIAGMIVVFVLNRSRDLIHSNHGFLFNA